MTAFDKETEIIEIFQETTRLPLFYPHWSWQLWKVYTSIHNSRKWKNWKNSSRKSDPPPDFYCDELKLMMDVMRVDDHEFISKKGKIVNPTRTRESDLIQELRDKGLVINENTKIFLNVDTKLEGEEDHNYQFYKNAFSRIISNHKRSIRLYKENHPGYKVIFFVFDESSAYFEVPDKAAAIEAGFFSGRPHNHFLDHSFLSNILDSEIDYFVWYAPYKLLHTSRGSFFWPPIAIFDVKQISSIRHHDYAEDKIIGIEC